MYVANIRVSLHFRIWFWAEMGHNFNAATENTTKEIVYPNRNLERVSLG